MSAPATTRLARWGGLATAVASLGLFAALAFAPTALAAGPVIGLQPVGVPPKEGYFVLSAKPGQTLSGKVEVTNTGSAATVLLYPVDATTGQTTGAVYRSRQDPRTQVGAWVKLSATKLKMGAGKAALVPFRVTVPKNATPGQHLGGIVAQPPVSDRAAVPTHPGSPRGGNRGGFRVRVQELAVVAVEVNLPGPRVEQMAITRIRAGTQAGRQTLAMGLANTGNALLKGTGSLAVVDSQGRRVLTQRFALDTFVPKTSVDYLLMVAGRTLPAGDYRGTITLTYGHGHRLSRTLPFSIGNRQLANISQERAPRGGDNVLWLILAGVALLLLGAGGSAAYFKHKGRPAAVTAGSTGSEDQAIR